MITIEEIHEAFIKQVVRATAAEEKVKQLETKVAQLTMAKAKEEIK